MLHLKKMQFIILFTFFAFTLGAASEEQEREVFCASYAVSYVVKDGLSLLSRLKHREDYCYSPARCEPNGLASHDYFVLLTAQELIDRGYNPKNISCYVRLQKSIAKR